MLVLVVPRKYVLAPFIIGACFLPADQRIIIAGLDFTVLRILVVAGILRLLVRGENRVVHLNRFDIILFVWVLVGAIVYVLLWLDSRALIYKCGVLFDVLGLYWLFRLNIRSWSDIIFTFKVLAVSAVALAPFVGYEWSTGHNPFTSVGQVLTDVRQDRYRCQAAFPHAIMLGLFWATQVPLFIGLATIEKKKLFWALAVGASVFIVIASASSTPLATLVAVCLFLLLYKVRKHGRSIAWAVCGIVILLNLVMNAPVWHLISRVNMVGGSTGWHRFFLIDQFVKHFGEWVLIGTRDTSHWGRGLGDVTNQYIAQGITGGLITLVLFIYLLVVAVRTVGSFSLRPLPAQMQWFAWCVCVSMLGHCVSFLGVTYFGQIRMLLYLTFAMTSAIYQMSQTADAYQSVIRWRAVRPVNVPSQV